jgi:hypothetical protein
MTEGNAATRHGWGLWLRLALYAGMLPSLVIVPLGIGRTQTAVACVVGGLVLCIAAAAWPRSRSAVANAIAGSRVLRGIDALLWNVAIVLAVGEVVLTVAGRFVSSPLLATPNASAHEHIERARRDVFAYFGRDTGNARGYTDVEPRNDAPGSVRIVALGDSFAYGIVGYEKNFLTLLEAKLGARVGRPVEVLNLGLPGLQPKDYLQMLADEGMALHPDLVLVCLFAGNDFSETGDATPFDARNWRLVGFALRLARYAAERGRHADPGAAQVDAPKGWMASPSGFSPEAYLELATKYVPLLRRERDASVQSAIDDTLAIVGEIAAFAAPTPVAVVVLPSELQVNPQLRASVLSQLRLHERDLDLDAPARETRARLEGRGIPVIDLLPALSAAERGGNTFATRDSHWNERGNGVAAELLAETLEATVRRIAEAKQAPTSGDGQQPRSRSALGSR